LGGAYELYFDPSNHNHMSTIGCKIIEYKPPTNLGFQWKGPDQFIEIMNQPEPLTYVHIEFVKNGATTKMHIIHYGWKSGVKWEESKRWHKRAWESVLRDLETYLNK
jgi:hypothetical protein